MSEPRSIDDDMPCGRCEVGVYSYASILTPLADRLAAQSPEDRRPPRCKTLDRACVGACHFIDAINRDPDGWLKTRAEALAEDPHHGT